MSKLSTDGIIFGMFAGVAGSFLSLLYRIGYRFDLSTKMNQESLWRLSCYKFSFIKWEVYLTLFIAICLNLVILLFKKNIRIYTFLSLGISTAFFVLLLIWSNDIYLLSSPYRILISCTIYLVFLLVKARWYVTFLLNISYIFFYINLIPAISYRNPFQSYNRLEFGEIIRMNIDYACNLRAIGFFVSNIGMIIVFLSTLLFIILNINLKYKHTFE